MDEQLAGPASSAETPSVVGQRLHTFLDAERAADDLRRYFAIGLPPGAAGVFTGGRFEHLAGGGDRRQVANRFTAQDLIAVQTLSVTVPAPVALDLLEGQLGAQLAQLLGSIPTGTDLADADASVVADGSPAYQAWSLLENQHKVGWVIAGNSWPASDPGCCRSMTGSCAALSAARRPSGPNCAPPCERTTEPCTTGSSSCDRARACPRRSARYASPTSRYGWPIPPPATAAPEYQPEGRWRWLPIFRR